MSDVFVHLAQKFEQNNASVQDFEAVVYIFVAIMSRPDIDPINVDLMLQSLKISDKLLRSILSFYVPIGGTFSWNIAKLIVYTKGYDRIVSFLPTKQDIDEACRLILLERNGQRQFRVAAVFAAAHDDMNNVRTSHFPRISEHRGIWKRLKAHSTCKSIYRILNAVLSLGWLPLLAEFDDSTELSSMSAIAVQCSFLQKLFDRVKQSLHCGTDNVRIIHESCRKTLIANWRFYQYAQLKDWQSMRLGTGAMRLMKAVNDNALIDGEFIAKFEKQTVEQSNLQTENVAVFLSAPSPKDSLLVRSIACLCKDRNWLDDCIGHVIQSDVDRLEKKLESAEQRLPSVFHYWPKPLSQESIRQFQKFAENLVIRKTAILKKRAVDDDGDVDDKQPGKVQKIDTQQSVAASDPADDDDREKAIAAEEKTSAMVAQLQHQMATEGYVLMKKAFTPHVFLADAMSAEVNWNTQTQKIFNHSGGKSNEEEFDGKRLQLPMEFVTNALISQFRDTLYSLLKTYFPQHNPHDPVILYSKAGCQRQASHADYETTAALALAPDIWRPFGALVAVESGTKLYVWPRSHKLSFMHPDLWDDVEPIDPCVIYLDKGDVLVFDGTLIHSGAEYTEQNVRAHFYLDTDHVARPQNETMLVRGDVHGNMSMPNAFKKIIKQ